MGGWRVAVDGAEVALAINQGIAHVPGLSQPDHGVINRGVAVGVIFLDHFAHYRGAFGVGALGSEPFLEHGVKDSSLYRLETVAHIGKRPVGDNRHSVVDKALFDFFSNLDR